MLKKIVPGLLACSLLVAPINLSAKHTRRVKNLYRICAITGAVSWLTWATGLAFEKDLLNSPLKKPTYFCLASLFSVIAAYELVEFIHLMRE